MTRVRDVVWHAGAPVRILLIGGIRAYRFALSGWLGGQCRYLPSCSRYAEAAIRTHGAIRGSALAVWRVARCNPFGRGGLEPVPPTRRAAKRYDEVIRGAGAGT